ncbi:MAG: hypothetical protein H6797_02805 [Candidatus Nomurabacteria bacterium]|nr:MAG: hypothetical protein H6797_02805 [Candidatus Nomurabacteria bacterium]
MTHPFSACNENCPTPVWCIDKGCVHTFATSAERHDQEPDDFICPEDIACDSQEICDSIGFCRKQLVHPTETAWYQRIRRLGDIIGYHQIWLLSGNIDDICIVDQWLNLKCEPTTDEKLRMLAADRWLTYVQARKGISFARSWFIGNNFYGFPAYVALRDDMFALLEESAKECVGSTIS